MSYFVCPHCNHEIDIFSRGGAEKTAAQFEVAFLGTSNSIPTFASQEIVVSLLSSKVKILPTPSHSMNSRVTLLLA